MSSRYLNIDCPECGGQTRPRTGLAGFVSCVECGKLIVAPKAEADPLLAGDPDAAVLTDQGEVVVPDQIGVDLGWRAWGIDPDLYTGTIPLLHSVTYSDHVWEPRVRQEADCSGVTHSEDHPVPVETCDCGLYAAKTFRHLQSMKYHEYDAEARGMFHVVGEVALWGKVIEGTQGWRAQYGYPRRLWVPYEAHRLAKPLRKAYGVPVSLKNTLKKTISEEV